MPMVKVLTKWELNNKPQQMLRFVIRSCDIADINQRKTVLACVCDCANMLRYGWSDHHIAALSTIRRWCAGITNDEQFDAAISMCQVEPVKRDFARYRKVKRTFTQQAIAARCVALAAAATAKNVFRDYAVSALAIVLALCNEDIEDELAKRAKLCETSRKLANVIRRHYPEPPLSFVEQEDLCLMSN